jgi:hypothetical protein
MFILLTVYAVFFGRRNNGKPMESWGEVKPVAGATKEKHDPKKGHKVPGTVVLTLIFLISFAVYYFANWAALADVWHVR